MVILCGISTGSIPSRAFCTAASYKPMSWAVRRNRSGLLGIVNYKIVKYFKTNLNTYIEDLYLIQTKPTIRIKLHVSKVHIFVAAIGQFCFGKLLFLHPCPPFLMPWNHPLLLITSNMCWMILLVLLFSASVLSGSSVR